MMKQKKKGNLINYTGCMMAMALSPTAAVVSCAVLLAQDPPVKTHAVGFTGADIVNCNKNEGWIWIDNAKTGVRFCKKACEKPQGGEVEKVSATFGCRTRVVT